MVAETGSNRRRQNFPTRPGYPAQTLRSESPPFVLPDQAARHGRISQATTMTRRRHGHHREILRPRCI
jgi:hypothetical protein